MLVLVLDLPLLVLQVQNRPPLGMVQRGAPVASAQDKRDKHGPRDRLQTQPPPDGIDGRFDEGGHDRNAESAARDDEDFDKLAPLLEVLRHHQRRAVPGHANPNADDGT